MNKKIIVSVTVSILIVGILGYLFYPRLLAGKISIKNELSISEMIPELNVDEDIATTDILNRAAYIKSNEKNYNEIINILKEIKYYKGFNFTTNQKDKVKKYLVIADSENIYQKNIISIMDNGKICIGDETYSVYGGNQKAKEVIQEIEERVELKKVDVE